MQRQATEERDMPNTEELEIKGELNTTDLELETEQLKQSTTVPRPHDSSNPDSGTTLDSASQSVKDKNHSLDGDASYNLLRSIAFDPVATQPGVCAAREHLSSLQPDTISCDNKGSASVLSSRDKTCDTIVNSSPKSSPHQHTLDGDWMDGGFVIIEHESIPELLHTTSHSQERGDTRHKKSCHEFIGESSLDPNHAAEGSVDPGTGERSLTSTVQFEAHGNLRMYSRRVSGRTL